jgi:hypothetical protein
MSKRFLLLLALVASCAATSLAQEPVGRTATAKASADAVMKQKLPDGTRLKLPVPNGKSGGALKPQLALMGAVAETVGGKEYSITKLTIVNWEKFSTRFFTASPHLPSCGKNKNSARSWLTIHRQDNGQQIYGYCALAAPGDLKDFTYATPKEEIPPLEVFVRLTDRATNTVYQSNCVNAWSGIGCGKP